MENIKALSYIYALARIYIYTFHTYGIETPYIHTYMNANIIGTTHAHIERQSSFYLLPVVL